MPEYAEGNFPIVGIGASAGGLEALQSLFRHIPENTGMGFVVIQHLSPDFKSMMPELLGKHTKMEVATAGNGTRVLPDHIYLIPVKKNITIQDRVLYLQEKETNTPLNLPIDLFFNSLGNDLEEQSVGIILSGTGSDGSRGIKMINEAGGTIIVQDPASAKFDGMPVAAINTGLADYVLPPDGIGHTLARFHDHPVVAYPERNKAETDEEAQAFSHILNRVKQYSGIDFTVYKPQTITRRLEKQMSIRHIHGLQEYSRYLSGNPEEVKQLFKEFLISVTAFFRDWDAFREIEEKVLPQIFPAETPRRSVRIWITGCATGEEPYSMAIMIDRYLEQNQLSHEYKIFASDVDKNAIDFASRGIYQQNDLNEFPDAWVERYFKRKDHTSLQIKDHIRDRIVFAKHNVIKDPPFIRIDLMVCRNLLIYLQPHIQKKLLLNFQFALNPDGYLFLGSSESVSEVIQGFEVISAKWKVYKNTSLNAKPSVNWAEQLQNHENTVLNTFSGAGNGEQPPEHQSDFFSDIIVDHFSPDGVFIDDDFKIQYIVGSVNDYLTFPRKKIVLNILNMVSADVGLCIRNGIRRAAAEQKTIVYPQIPTGKENDRVEIKISHHGARTSNGNYFLVEFHPVEEAVQYTEVSGSAPGESVLKEKINELEAELKAISQELRATVEELETSNEEMQAANEELMASNEELQTSNQELQSVNQELYAVNTELQQKMHQLALANKDIDNLLKSTFIGTIFLEKDYSIRLFTPKAKQHFHLAENDIGRKLTDLTENIVNSSLEAELGQVLENEKAITRAVTDHEGNRFLKRIQPYLNEHNACDGFVITYVNVDILSH